MKKLRSGLSSTLSTENKSQILQKRCPCILCHHAIKNKSRCDSNNVFRTNQPSGVHAKSYTYVSTRKEGCWWNPSLEVLIGCSISKRFYHPCCRKGEVYFIGGSAAGDLWCHQTWSPSRPLSWILPRIRNQVKTERIGNISCFKCKIAHK